MTTSTPGPFIGLSAFTQRTARYFTGRERFALTLAGAVLRSRITVLYGKSGAGKSSVLGAALPQALRAVLRRPPERGEALAAAAAGVQPRTIVLRRWQPGFEAKALRQVRRALGATGSASLREAVQIWSETRRSTLVLVLDQFEEFSLARTGSGGEEFLRELAGVVADEALDAHVLVSLREDALALLDHLRALMPGILASPVELRPLSAEAARRAIRDPVKTWSAENLPPGERLSIEDEFVEALVRQVQESGVNSTDDSKDDAVVLPLLQLAVTRVWQEVDKGGAVPHLRLTTLNALDGVPGILREHLQRTVGSLPSDRRSLAADLFGQLVTASGAKQAWRAADLAAVLDERRRAVQAANPGYAVRWAATLGGRLAPALTGAGHPVTDAAAITATLEPLASGGARLLRIQPDPTGGAPFFELLHDALARPVLEWVQRERIQRETTRQKRALLGWIAAAALIFAAAAGLGQWIVTRERYAAEVEERLRSTEEEAKRLRDAADPAAERRRLEDDPAYQLQLELRQQRAAWETAIRVRDDAIAERERRLRQLEDEIQHLQPRTAPSPGPAPAVDVVTESAVTGRPAPQDPPPPRAEAADPQICRGAMWIGSDATSGLKDVLPSQVRPREESYVATRAVVLRQGFPDAQSYRNQPSVGIVPEGTRVRLLEPPQGFARPNGTTQWWAQVVVPNQVCTLVYFQFAGGTRDDAKAFATALEAQGYSVPGQERLAAAQNLAEIRYFYADDRQRAELLKRHIESLLRPRGPAGREVQLRDYTGWPAQKPPRGTLELWLDFGQR